MRIITASRVVFAVLSVGVFWADSLCGETKLNFRAGAATSDITPKPGVSLDGPISKNGPVTGVNDRLHVRAIVLDDGNMRLAIAICDACMIGREVFDAAKAIVTDKTGLPPDRVLLAATHTHAAIRAVHIGTSAADDEYHKFLALRIADAVLRAEKNLAPAQIGYGSFDKAEFVSCRRFLCEPGSVGVNPFGVGGERIKSVAGRSSAVIRPAGPVDPQFSILSIRHADGKPLAVLGNFSVHYCGGYRRGFVSADYFGHYAAAMEGELNAGNDRPPFVGIMSNGTSGNTGSIQRGGQSYPPFEWMKVSARNLAKDTLKVVDAIEHRADIRLAMVESELKLRVRRPDEKRLAWAKAILADSSRTLPHRWSKVYAQEAQHLGKYPVTIAIKLQALRIGDIAIAAIPSEVFAETGLAIKAKSHHKSTFTIELANGYSGYLPTAEQHELGGYETWPARSSFLELEAESKIRAEVLRLLDEVIVPKK